MIVLTINRLIKLSKPKLNHNSTQPNIKTPTTENNPTTTETLKGVYTVEINQINVFTPNKKWFEVREGVKIVVCGIIYQMYQIIKILCFQFHDH